MAGSIVHDSCTPDFLGALPADGHRTKRNFAHGRRIMLSRSTNDERQGAQVQGTRVRLGEFELDLRAGELSGGGKTLRLQEQPLQILLMLLKGDGEIVTREEICRELWADGTIVEFDHSINAAILKLRRALRDSANCPRYIQTVARRGYRLLMPTQWLECQHSAFQPLHWKDNARQTPRSFGSHSADDGPANLEAPKVCLVGSSRLQTTRNDSNLSGVHKPRRNLRERYLVLVQTPEKQRPLWRLGKLVYGRVRRSSRLRRYVNYGAK